jgi:hypothetical protein
MQALLQLTTLFFTFSRAVALKRRYAAILKAALA